MMCITGIHTCIQLHSAQSQQADQNPACVSVPVLRGSERDTRVIDVQGEEIGSGEEWRGRRKVKWRVDLGILCVYTCGGENQRLQDIRKRDDALDAGVIIHHYQPVHLQDTHTHTTQTLSGAV